MTVSAPQSPDPGDGVVAATTDNHFRADAQSLGRRRLITGAIAAAAAIPVVATQAGTADAAPAASTTVRNVRDYGAKGDGSTDDTAAFKSAVSAGGDAVVLYVPAGYYKIAQMPNLPNYSYVFGDGPDISVVVYEKSGVLITLRDKARVVFKNVGLWAVGTNSTLLQVSQSFRCSFDTVVIRGSHSSSNYPQYANQKGVILDENSGATAFINCDINNLGIGLTTSCIQNYIESSRFTFNYIGVLGTGNNYSAGLSMNNVEFVSDREPKTTDVQLKIDGNANDWWLTNVWFEGCATAVLVGSSKGGPSQFGMVNCKVAGRDVCIDLVYCRQAYLANVALDYDPGSTPIELRINPDTCAEGTAIGLISSTRADVPPATFPPRWTVIGRGTHSGTTFTSQVVVRKPSNNADQLQFQGDNSAVNSRFTANGTFVSEKSTQGVVLRGANNHYYRLIVNSSGSLQAQDIGTASPS